MLVHRMSPIVLLLLWHVWSSSALPHADRDLQDSLLAGYNKKIRPVKAESTVTQVTVFLNIAHVEKVDEEEQTALVHGHLWASWTDEYLTWDRKKNNITKISIPSNRIWQPALALYNSARGNTWHLYMTGLPSSVYFSGKVWSSGTFSFFVTCQFDFTNWPFDQQNCPIVIADWVYGLAQVNLSDPNNMAEYARPSIKMSYDPFNTQQKRHVGGWEVLNSWKKHCYWGPQGCKDSQPEGEPDWYWSLLEFGITLKRHLPYYQLTAVLPMAITSAWLLLIFWVDDCITAVFMILINFTVQATYGWTLLRQMPPGSGSIPKIVQLYMLTGFFSVIQFALVIYSCFLEARLAKKFAFNFGFDITAIPKHLGVERLFKKPELSFDPQEIFTPFIPESIRNAPDAGGSPLDGLSFVNPVEEKPASSDDTAMLINLPTNSEPEPSEKFENPVMEDAKKPTVIPMDLEEERLLAIQLHHIKRYSFFLSLALYIIAFFLVLFA